VKVNSGQMFAEKPRNGQKFAAQDEKLTITAVQMLMTNAAMLQPVGTEMNAVRRIGVKNVHTVMNSQRGTNAGRMTDVMNGSQFNVGNVMNRSLARPDGPKPGRKKTASRSTGTPTTRSRWSPGLMQHYGRSHPKQVSLYSRV